MSDGRPTRDIKKLTMMRHKREWHEDDGDVLWWTSPVTEPPYCGTPNDFGWPGYHHWWTPLPNVTCWVRNEAISPEAGVRKGGPDMKWFPQDCENETKLNARIAELEEALQPFARYDVRTGRDQVATYLKVDDINRARRLLGRKVSTR